MDEGRAPHLRAAGARRLTLRVDAGMSALYRARFGGPRPAVREKNGTVTIDYPRLTATGWPGLGRRAAEVDLTPGAAWDLALAGSRGCAAT